MAIAVLSTITCLLLSTTTAMLCRRQHRKVQTFSGVCNNLYRPHWGSANRPFKLLTTPLHHNIAHLPNPRAISNAICSETRPLPNRRNMSELVTFFGQFLDHTITKTEPSTTAWPISVPPNDPVFLPGGQIRFFRTLKRRRPRGYSPVNELSSYIDLSSIYGTRKSVSDSLRTFSQGRLKTSANNLPTRDARGLFVSGDSRLNENPCLTTLHTLFIREHNAVAAEVARAFARMSEEGVFQLARKIVIAELQAAVYYEFLPAVLGREMPTFTRYNRWTQAAVSNAFSTVAFRVGHTMINADISTVDRRGRRRRHALRSAFFNPTPFMHAGVDGLLRGMMATRAAEVDAQVTSAVRDFLIESDRAQIDLAAVNIQRGRDHGVESYNGMREAFGMPRVRWFSEITADEGMRSKLREVYGSVDRVDAWVGGIAEDHEKGASMGPLFVRIWMREFERLRYGDRFYFENEGHFTETEIRQVPTLHRLLREEGGLRTVMRRIIVRNSGIAPERVPANPFFVQGGAGGGVRAV